MKALLRRKPLDALFAQAEQPGHRLRRTLGPVQLTALGIGAIVGAGIFSTVGTAAAGGDAHLGAGPALMLSFVLVAVACSFAALCYAELAAMVPISGSAYTYVYATLGELTAWIIGWDLVLEYAVSNAAVAVSWSDYFQVLLRGLGVQLPGWLCTDYRTAFQAAAQGSDVLRQAPHIFGLPIVFNLPAFGIVVGVTWVVFRGIRESAAASTSLAALKLGIVALFLLLGAFYVKPEHWVPFAPHGWHGISAAAAIIFFAYIGFDAVSTASEEARNPGRDMPIGILASLAICTAIYISVAAVLTGMVRWDALGRADPLAYAFEVQGLTGIAGLIAAGAVIATTSALIPYQIGQPRILFAMGRDGLLPGWASRVHPRYRTPHVSTLLTGAVVALCSSFTNINELVELTNIGTLFAFALVATGVLILRRLEPDRPRPFRVPLVPWIPLLAVGCCFYLMTQLPAITWVRFVGWLAIGLVLYLLYGLRRSRLRSRPGAAPNS